MRNKKLYAIKSFLLGSDRYPFSSFSQIICINEEQCSLPSRAMLLSFQSITLYHPEHCSQPSRALLSAVWNIAFRGPKLCSWPSKALLCVFESIAPSLRKHSFPSSKRKILLILTSHTPILLLTTSVSSTCNFYNIPSHLPPSSCLGGVPNQSAKSLILLVL